MIHDAHMQKKTNRRLYFFAVENSEKMKTRYSSRLKNVTGAPFSWRKPVLFQRRNIPFVVIESIFAIRPLVAQKGNLPLIDPSTPRGERPSVANVFRRFSGWASPTIEIKFAFRANIETKTIGFSRRGISRKCRISLLPRKQKRRPQKQI